MKIKSKFKDYYDGVNPLHAEEPLFLRQTQKFSFSYFKGSQAFDCPTGPLKDLLVQVAMLPVQHLIGEQTVVIFCGRVFSAASVSGHTSDPSGWPFFKTQYFWKPSKELTDCVVRQRKPDNRKFSSSDAESQIDKWFESQGFKDQSLLDAQLKALAPIVLRHSVLSTTKLVVDPILKGIAWTN